MGHRCSPNGNWWTTQKCVAYQRSSTWKGKMVPTYRMLTTTCETEKCSIGRHAFRRPLAKRSRALCSKLFGKGASETTASNSYCRCEGFGRLPNCRCRSGTSARTTMHDACVAPEHLERHAARIVPRKPLQYSATRPKGFCNMQAVRVPVNLPRPSINWGHQAVAGKRSIMRLTSSY